MGKRESKIQYFRKKTAFYLDDSETRIGRCIVLFLLITNVFACILYIMGTYYESRSDSFLYWLAEVIIVVLFFVEYFLRVWSSEKRLAYIFSGYGIIDFLSIMPAVFFRELSFLRSFKVLRILRFMRLINPKVFIFRNLNSYQLQVCRTFLTVLTILFIASGFIFYAEHKNNIVGIGSIKTFADSFTFCVTTFTTVGYGELHPYTHLGRFFTIAMIISGVLFIPWQIGKLLRLIIKSESGKIKIKCKECGLNGHDPDAKYCKSCGTLISML